MKKLLALLLVGLLVLTACGSTKEDPKPTPGEETVTYKIGTAVVNGVKTAEPEAEKAGKFESNVTFATVALDADEKIAFVSIDTNQNEISFTADALNEFAAKGSKKELGDDYGMSKAGKVEWDKQIASLEEYLIGKTIAEVNADKATTDLSSTVSITVNGYIDAVVAAAANAVSVENVATIAQTSTVGAKTDADKAPTVEISTTVAAVALDADGKIVYSFVDEAQLKADITAGVATPNENLKTKGQLGTEYGMSAAGKVEWNEQVKHLTDWTIGKTKEEVAKAADASDVTSTVSIYAQGFADTLTKAMDEAKAVK